MCPVAGIDLEPGSQPGLKGRYALVIIDCDGKVILSKRHLPFKKVVRFLWEYSPKVLAVDNIMELGSDKKELVKTISLMPPEMDVVQVTRLPNGIYLDVKKIASMMDIEVPQRKLDPEETARILAILASKGVGSRLKTFEEKTKIIVTKARTPRAGGSSMDRFKRAVKNAVAETISDIKKRLEDAGLDYDVVIDKSDGAIERAIFTVYAPRKALKGVIKPLETSAVKVMIRPVVSRRIDFVEGVERESKYLIIGYDPGIESGLAVLDLDGKVILVTSSRELDRGDVISIINKLGIPVIVASDTNPPTHSVKKLASRLNAILYTPKTSLSVKEKERIVKEIMERQGIEVTDSHQRDALAAAYKAYLSVKDKLEHVDSYLSKVDLEFNKDKVRAEVIKGRPLAEVIEEEIDRILESQESIYSSQMTTEETDSGNRSRNEGIDKYLERIKYLEAENMLLKEKMEELNELIKEKDMMINLIKDEAKLMYEGQLESMRRALRELNIEYEKSINELKVLKEKIKKMEEFMILLSRNEIVVAKKVDKISFVDSPEDLGLDNHDYIMYVKKLEDVNEDMLNYIIENEVVIIADEYSKAVKEKLEHNTIPLLHEKPIFEGTKIALFKREILEQWEEEKEELKMKKENEITEETIMEMIAEYRSERWGI